MAAAVASSAWAMQLQQQQAPQRHPQQRLGGQQQWQAAAAAPRRVACRAAQGQQPATVGPPARSPHRTPRPAYPAFALGCLTAAVPATNCHWQPLPWKRHARLATCLPSPGPAVCLPPRVSALQQPFPQDYNQAVRQAQAAVQAALADGATLLEVEFPTASIASVAGDAEGGWVWWGAVQADWTRPGQQLLICGILCRNNSCASRGSAAPPTL